MIGDEQGNSVIEGSGIELREINDHCLVAGHWDAALTAVWKHASRAPVTNSRDRIAISAGCSWANWAEIGMSDKWLPFSELAFRATITNKVSAWWAGQAIATEVTAIKAARAQSAKVARGVACAPRGIEARIAIASG